MKQLESKLQEACIKWFDYSYPAYRQLLFAIPNGGARNVITGAMLKRQGVRKGIPDLFLSIPKYSKHETSFVLSNGLYIEMKIGKGKQTAEQITFMSLVAGKYIYEVIRDFDSFKKLIEEYLSVK